MNSEKDVKKEVKKVLDKHNWFWWMPPANGFGRVGVSDFNALRSGVFMAVETKFGKNTPTVQQKAYLSSIAAEEGFGFIVSDKNLDWFKAFMEAFDRSADHAARKVDPSPEDGATMLNAIRELTHGLG